MRFPFVEGGEAAGSDLPWKAHATDAITSIDVVEAARIDFYMATILESILDANQRYAQGFGDKRNLAMPPSRRFAILTCMDARLDPAKYAGLDEGDAHVVRNAGGRASEDAIRSLVISYKLLGTREWFVIHHTDCGMETFSDEIMRGLLAKSLDHAVLESDGWHDRGSGSGTSEAQYIDWLTIRNQEESIAEDIGRLRRHPLVPSWIPIHGFLYDVRSGVLRPVATADSVGMAK
jgi:carbonic anhydrase